MLPNCWPPTAASDLGGRRSLESKDFPRLGAQGLGVEGLGSDPHVFRISEHLEDTRALDTKIPQKGQQFWEGPISLIGIV